MDRDFRRRPTATNNNTTTDARLSVSSASSSSAAAAAATSLHALAPPVQPLPDGLHLLIDAPISASTTTATMTTTRTNSCISSSSATSSSCPSPPPPPPPSQRKLPNLPPGPRARPSRRQQHSGPTPSVPITGPVFPPHKEIIAGCRVFVSSYFQLGFLPKALFLEAITRNVHAVSPFLLSSILSISARFTPALVRRYGNSAVRATETFLHISRTLAPAEMYHPSLERTQAFFLLAIAEWGHGDKERSAMDMGVAVRMASILKLHREETYAYAVTPEQIVRAESARRTFWMLHSQENLQAGYSAPAPFAPEDITARLPCDERSFALGVPVPPTSRAVLAATVPALQEQQQPHASHRCLFATMIQAHQLWGQVARRACRADLKMTTTPPWDASSEYQLLTRQLRTFESELPERYRWSLWNLRAWQEEELHLSYLAMVMVLRVANIVERRIYLDEILMSVNNNSSQNDDVDDMMLSPRSTSATKKQAPAVFWNTMASELFENVLELAEQIHAFSALLYAAPEEEGCGFPAIVVFCVYICGSLASYLWRYPQLCPHIAPRRAEATALRCVQVLHDLHEAWPTSTRWNQGLQQIAGPLAAMASNSSSQYSGRSCSSSGDSPLTSSSMHASLSGDSGLFGGAAKQRGGGVSSNKTTSLLDEEDENLPIDPRLAGCSQIKPEAYGNGSINSASGLFWKGAGDAELEADPEAFPNELFEAEMSTLLAGDADFGWLDFERGGN